MSGHRLCTGKQPSVHASADGYIHGVTCVAYQDRTKGAWQGQVRLRPADGVTPTQSRHHRETSSRRCTRIIIICADILVYTSALCTMSMNASHRTSISSPGGQQGWLCFASLPEISSCRHEKRLSHVVRFPAANRYAREGKHYQPIHNVQTCTGCLALTFA